MAPSNEIPHKPHVVVVGAGILGASIAFHLTLRGAQVTMAEAGEPGQGASRVSFAWLNSYDKNPFPYHDLNRRSMEMWERFKRRLGADIDLVWGGELRWSVTPEGAAALAARAQVLQAWGYPARMMDATDIRQLEPDLAIGEMTAASYTDIDGHVNTGDVIRACISAAEARGAELRTQAPVTGIQLSQMGTGTSRVEGITIGEQTIPCDAAVLAGGPDMSALAGLAGVDLPLYHTFGATILTEPIAPLFKHIAVLHPAHDRPPTVNFRQFSDGVVMIGATARNNQQDGDRARTDSDVAQIMEEAAAILPALQGVRVQEVRQGRRPIPQDGVSIIGFSDTVPNLYLATTHSGVTLAPIIGEFAAMEIVDGAAIDLLQPFRLARFRSN
ncbi:NAD(P)/FAD-dependent oxidoreductase [Candidatus Entotheonella palauensis]|nr:FAD-dependent oxidoreductase [Candidatus Entotheonella palauensis]